MDREHGICLLTQALAMYMSGFPDRRELSGSFTVSEEKQEGMIFMGNTGRK